MSWKVFTNSIFFFFDVDERDRLKQLPQARDISKTIKIIISHQYEFRTILS